ncbi:MAG: AvaI/BsoBI family type II restriction endonuclease [Candidatus Cloacimonadota bacterium]|nr:AvaI/BsoBI family type II restriction endonuclease [Candidatus Cloacimonadota bacterium]
MPFNNHLKSYKSLITPYEETRAGFISLALEKNRKATPFVEEAKVLKVFALKARTPKELLQISEIQKSLLTAAGISDKAKNHLQEDDKKEAIKKLIENFLEPSGKSFVDELVYRFLLTRGDSLGGSMRNLAGALGEWRFTRILMSTCSVSGIDFEYLDSKSKNWMIPNSEPEIEKLVKGLRWMSHGNERTLIYNLTVPTVKKNVDLCLFDCSPNEIIFGKNKDSAHYKPEKYLALGELKGGIDPAGADEHWKTANSALGRIRKAFSDKNCNPKTFFIGAAIENAMAEEIYQQLNNNTLSNGANLTNEDQVVSLCDWLIKI